MSARRRTTVTLGAGTLLTACSTQGTVSPDAIAGKTPDAFVNMEQMQAAYIGSDGAGAGGIGIAETTGPPP